MSYENVKLWFAKDESDNIITIDEINKEDKNTYLCPVCGSILKPKAIESKRITPHFAHIDASKCNSETMIHWWFKHKFIEKGDKFTVVSDVEKQYVCKDVLVEQSYETEECVYRPDVTVLTECGNTIYFEMAFSNKKKVKDYMDIWLELRNIVVEVDIKQLMFKDKGSAFKALFYDGKCFNTKRNDTYYNTIGKYKEEKLKGNVSNELKERIRKLDWFWDDILRYNSGEVDIEHMANLIDSIDGYEKYIIEHILNKNTCIMILNDYKKYKLNKYYSPISNLITDKYGKEYLNQINYKIDGNGNPLISVFDSANYNSQRFLDIRHHSLEHIINKIDNIIASNIKHTKNKNLINEYNNDVTRLRRRISSTKKYREYKKYILELDKYDLEYYVESLSTNPLELSESFNFDEYNLTFQLLFNLIPICKYETNFKKDEKISFTLESFIEKFNNYLSNVKPLQNVGILNLSKELNSSYPYYKYYLRIEGDLISEDMYCIDIYENSTVESFLICNDGVYSLIGTPVDNLNKKMLLGTNNLEQIKVYFKNIIENKIENKSSSLCKDCNKNFKLSFGEITFFRNKNFTLPKRCKSCRTERKQNN